MTDAKQAWEGNLAKASKQEHPDIKSSLCRPCYLSQERYYKTTKSSYQMLPYVTVARETCEVCGAEGATRYLAYWFADVAVRR